MPKSKQIIALGGGGFTMEKSPAADKYILDQSKKKSPKICFLPTASGDNADYTRAFLYIFDMYGCDASALPLINPPTSDLEDFVLSQDIIYVGGGNTKSMMAIWKEWGMDKILHKAYEQEVILSGVSAGSVCWFRECLSDSIPDTFITLPCLNILPTSNCVHYNEKDRREKYLQNVQKDKLAPGYALENGTGLHFINGELLKSFSTLKKAKNYYVSRDNNSVIEKELEIELI